MPNISRRLLKTASLSRNYLDKVARREIVDFIRSKQNPDGGFCGRDRRSDPYYTLFAIACLSVFRQPIPLVKLWKYVRSFKTGRNTDFVHAACLARLRSIFPVSPAIRRKRLAVIEQYPVENAYDAFLKTLAYEGLFKKGQKRFSDGLESLNENLPTTHLAAIAVMKTHADKEIVALLLSRHCSDGGFCANPKVPVPDLLSTAVALFALHIQNANLNEIRKPCLEFIESLWRESGGFAGHASDAFEDVEYTFYGLLGIGCLLE